MKANKGLLPKKNEGYQFQNSIVLIKYLWYFITLGIFTAGWLVDHILKLLYDRYLASASI